MGDMKVLPVFAFTGERAQLQQIREYLKQHGAPLDDGGPSSIQDNLLEIVKTVDVVGDLASDKEVEMVLSSISSLLVVLTSDQATLVVGEFCEKLSSEHYKGVGWSSNAGAAVRILSNLFHAFYKYPIVQHLVFVALVKLCGRAQLTSDLDTSMPQLKEYFKKWSLKTEQKRNLLRFVHGALINDGKADQAAKTMTELLATYTDEDAASAIEDGRECVRTAIVDPRSFCFDHLLRLPAVKQLEKTDPIMHMVLLLFATGTLADYRAFMKEHPNFVSENLHVHESVLVKKMQLLTLMSLAEKDRTISLNVLSKEIELSGDELEEFIFEAVQVNAVTGKINGVLHEFNVTSIQPRCFGREQWEMLEKRLVSLIDNLNGCLENINGVMDEKLA